METAVCWLGGLCRLSRSSPILSTALPEVEDTLHRSSRDTLPLTLPAAAGVMPGLGGVAEVASPVVCSWASTVCVSAVEVACGCKPSATPLL